MDAEVDATEADQQRQRGAEDGGRRTLPSPLQSSADGQRQGAVDRGGLQRVAAGETP